MNANRTLIGWKSGKTTFVPLWDRMEGAWLSRLRIVKKWRENVAKMPRFFYSALPQPAPGVQQRVG